MKANTAKDTKPELLLRAALQEAGLTGYKLNWNGAPGRPDVAFPRKKLAIFVHGCFWHRCPHCHYPLPKSNREFWRLKFRRNKERDKRKRSELGKSGWKVLELWECEIKKDSKACVRMIRKHLRGVKT